MVDVRDAPMSGFGSIIDPTTKLMSDALMTQTNAKNR
jgi:hypothetical protein